jgi:dipeptidyl aminopeptidase/acylaminoacyl peptidase
MPAWERRFRAPAVTLPSWSPTAPDRFTFSSNESGTWQLYAWDPQAGLRRRVTDDPVGITDGTPTPDGSEVVWFHDAKGDEFGRHLVAPFESGGAEPFVQGVGDGWSAGIAMREGVVALALGDREGFAVYVSVDGEPAREIFRHEEIAVIGAGERDGTNLGAISADGTLVCYAHAEHGDPLHPALRVVDARTNETVGDLWDGEGKALSAWAWSPVPGDQRLAITHEQTERERPAIWDLASGERTNLDLDVPGSVAEVWDWWPDGSAILAVHSHDGRDELLRLDATSGAFDRVSHPAGSISDARVRPNGEVWLVHSDGAHAPRVLSSGGDVVLAASGEPAPDGAPFESWEFHNPGAERVHGFLVRPDGDPPYPLVVDIHGGPTWQWYDTFTPKVQAWVDHGFAVALVNYRGSTGYGAAWRDRLIGDPGFPETEDTLAGVEDLIARGVADPERIVLSGASWGGYLTLLGIGLHPARWAVALASVPVADYVAAFEDEAPALQAMDRGLFGGGPHDSDELRRMYDARSPITYVDRVKTPLLILAGENDSRCPIRQIDNYAAALRARGAEVDVYRYDTGHSSFVVDESVRQMQAKLAFAQAHLPSV